MAVFKVSKRVFIRAMINKKQRHHGRRASHRLLIQQIRRHNHISSLRASLSPSTRNHPNPSRRRSRSRAPSPEIAVFAHLSNTSVALLYQQFKDQAQSRENGSLVVEASSTVSGDESCDEDDTVFEPIARGGGPSWKAVLRRQAKKGGKKVAL